MHYILTYLFQCCLIFRQALIMPVLLHGEAPTLSVSAREDLLFPYLHIPLNQCSLIFRQAMDFNTRAVTRQGDVSTTLGEQVATLDQLHI